MFYYIAFFVIILLVLISFVLSKETIKRTPANNLGKLIKFIEKLYYRKPSKSELYNIIQVIKKYQDQYKYFPHEKDLKRIVLKYKE